ncbi:hypothetical protein A9G13_05740 [Gilliamella sp. wkB178]|uniref:hypothetical protein n=1 Tax=Gilliamella sp. wkB178 TaxID=3120259 RepID=UPI00080EA26A|nr:hypothetical protein [Gilliamella apicola]OCG07714.1 hypothetical protein A9G13_05740 [Gilliamella apicola]
MTIHKKPLFTLIPSNEAILSQKTLNQWDANSNNQNLADEVFALRIKKHKLHHTTYTEKEYTNEATTNNREFRFIFNEIFESEHHAKQIRMLKDEIALDEESNKIKELLANRLKEIIQIYPKLKFDLHNCCLLPKKIKDYLFAPPLILTADNSIMLWDD